jgi:AcrR family transcriptional regulator
MGLETNMIDRAKMSTSQRALTAKAKKPKPKKAGRPTAAELERRKALVMTVATDLFVSHGYAATSLVDIARGAGVATRTLYQHFGDKEAMFREVIFARDTGVALPRPDIEPDDTLFSALIRASRYTYDVSFQQRSVGLMRLMIAESNRFPEFMRKIANSIFARFRRNIEDVFRQLAATGLIPSGDHSRSAELFSDLVLGSQPIMTYTNWDSSPPTAEDLEERVDLFIRGRFDDETVRHARTRKAGVTKAV